MSKNSREKRQLKHDLRLVEGKKTVRPLEAKSEAQAHYMTTIESNIITFGIGSAGTGKTYVATAMAGQLLYEKKISKIVITRPAVESGAKMGHLPGTLEEKFAPYLNPIREVLVERYGKGWYESQIKNGNIEPVPLGFMQGLTFDNSFVLADEMQNSTPDEMFMLLSRVGEFTKVVINGDFKMQKMVRGKSGLEDGLDVIGDVPNVGSYEFCSDDIVRSGIARDIIKKYEAGVGG